MNFMVDASSQVEVPHMKRMVFGMLFLGMLGIVGQAQAGLYYGQPLPPPGGMPPNSGIGTDPVFDFTFASNDGSVLAFGSVDASSNGDGTFTAFSGSGTVAGATPDNGGLTLFPNPSPPGEVVSPSGFFLYDNQVLPGQNPLITNGGFLFTLADGTELNIFSNGPGPGTYTLYENNGFNINGNFALTELAVPEPSTLVLGCLGCVVSLVGACVRGRKVASPGLT
jgi:hypothetical protein